MARPRCSSVFALAALVGITAAAGCSFAHRSSAATPSQPKVNSVLHLDSFLVNLNGGGYLRVGIDLGLDTASKEGGEAATPPVAPIRDTILGVLTAASAAPLLTPEGKEELKKQIVAAINKQNPSLGLVAVYFTDFLVQPQ